MKNPITKQKGSIALISVLIISAMLLTMVVSMSEVNVSSAYLYLNKNSNDTMQYVAESCLEESIIRLEQDQTFASTLINFDNGATCTANVSGTDISIGTTYLDYTQNFNAEISLTQAGQANNIGLLKWEEI